MYQPLQVALKSIRRRYKRPLLTRLAWNVAEAAVLSKLDRILTFKEALKALLGHEDLARVHLNAAVHCGP